MKAIISVSNKTGIVELGKELEKLGFTIISTGGTYHVLQNSGIKVREVSSLTGFPECLDGRVKTLHPNIHAGILARRDVYEHMEQIAKLKIEPIDLVVVNLYPFKETILKNDTDFADAVENIDIGGPTMLRAAAKNYRDVAVVVDPADYSKIIEELKNTEKISLATRLYLMRKVFRHTAAYDGLIAEYLGQAANATEFPDDLTLVYEKVQDMRYGENPHQKAAFYREILRPKGALTDAVQLHGKPLSFNNINDTNGALELLKEFGEPTVVACKHANPCGVGSDETIYGAWRKAFTADKVSIFGGIVTMNRELTEDIAREMNEIFLEVIVAPGYTSEALRILKSKKNLRILRLTPGDIPDKVYYDIKKVSGGIVIQTQDTELITSDYRVVTVAAPTKIQFEDLLFAMKIVKHTKSNAIVIVKGKQTVGIGPGQVNRIWAARQAIDHAKELIGKEATHEAVLASDAFFPFPDVVEAANQAKISAIIQPGGSIRDNESIDLCNQYRISMIFTGMRHFKH
ncbi:MAG: bifunctional phosphoribosylaminoimidazolecarboxamide formyltransferase/IMP cyclohydrolase [Bacilli bacterium]|nr:bifunctional phosphoribosylaminoimidazolecarboxamide formyltransferase/IMP cyclohydrolase [Bacilli bacterium]MDD4388340.1 bifunctional phosphoribosylaminoimidazolecarboxamide formyltransferase/IMP cyclohydrolase [Bacilli bacterium]